MTVDQSMSPGSAGEARGRRTDLAALRSEWQAVHGELSTVIEAILAQIFATASQQAVEVLARLEREGTDLLEDLELRRAAAQAEMTELAARLEHVERRVSFAEEERRQALDAAERATTELLVRARHQADQIVDEAETRAAARLAEAEHAATRMVADAEASAAQIVEEARRRAAEVERELERVGTEPEPVAAAEAAVVEDQLRGLAERISRLLQTTSEVTSTEATVAPVERARREDVRPDQGTSTAPTAARPEAWEDTDPAAVVPLHGTPDDDWSTDQTRPAIAPVPAEPLSPPEPEYEPVSVRPDAFRPHSIDATSEPADVDDDGDAERSEREVVVPLRPRAAGGLAAPGTGSIDDVLDERQKDRARGG
jgi:hypothetical protein